MDDHAADGGGGDLTRVAEAAADLEVGRKLFAGPVDFLRGVARLEQLPEAGLPEVAFAGRSNVGKSSLINALTGRNTLARTSNTPGRTQELNFFDLGGRLRLVDLPGYGYAKAPKDQVKRWTELVFAYLRGRATLARACLLIDARHGIKPIDAEVMDLLGKAAVPFAVVLTKGDLVGRGELAAREGEVTAALKRRAGALPEPLVTSSRKADGIDLLRAALAELAPPPTGSQPMSPR